MKPRSIKLFDILILIATLLVLASAILSFASLEQRALVGVDIQGEGARAMAIWMVIASLFIFALLAGVVWTSISLLRMGVMRFVLALVVLYALGLNYHTLVTVGPDIGGLVDFAASLVAAAAVFVLFRADARRWFAEDPRDRVAP